jgi:thymidylate synthase (FAD)
MKIVEQSWEYDYLHNLVNYVDMVTKIEMAAKNCYLSECCSSFSKSEDFIRKLIKQKHLSPFEHVNITVKIVTDRAVLAELTRHRIASYSVESQRFVKYNEVEFVLPVWYEDYVKGNSTDAVQGAEYTYWKSMCKLAEDGYFHLMTEYQCTPQEARMVLNNSTKVSLTMSTNVREWRHILELRTRMDNNPQMRSLTTSILTRFSEDYPTLFEDILEE